MKKSLLFILFFSIGLGLKVFGQSTVTQGVNGSANLACDVVLKSKTFISRPDDANLMFGFTITDALGGNPTKVASVTLAFDPDAVTNLKTVALFKDGGAPLLYLTQDKVAPTVTLDCSNLPDINNTSATILVYVTFKNFSAGDANRVMDNSDNIIKLRSIQVAATGSDPITYTADVVKGSSNTTRVKATKQVFRNANGIVVSSLTGSAASNISFDVLAVDANGNIDSNYPSDGSCNGSTSLLSSVPSSGFTVGGAAPVGKNFTNGICSYTDVQFSTSGTYTITSTSSLSGYATCGCGSTGVNTADLTVRINADRILPTFLGTATFNLADYNKALTNPITISGSTKLFSITVSDNDDDGLPTKINALRFSIQNSSNLQRLALFESATNIGEVAAGSDVVFDISTKTPNNTIATGTSAAPNSKEYTLYAIFQQNAITDNSTIDIQLTDITVSSSGASPILSTPNYANIKTTTGNNKLNVVATKQIFKDATGTAVTTTTAIRNNYFALDIWAVDVNNNLDKDATSTTISSTNSSFVIDDDINGDGVGDALQPFNGGIVSLNNIKYTSTGTSLPLSAKLTSNNVTNTITVTVTTGVLITQASTYTISTNTQPGICNNGNYVTLNDIVITESANSDFSRGTNVTFTMRLPEGFIFDKNNTSVGPTLSSSAGSILSTDMDLRASTTKTVYEYNISGNEVTFYYTVNGTSKRDKITLSGLKVKYTGTNYNASQTLPSPVYMLRSGGTAVQKGNAVADQQPLATLQFIDATHNNFGGAKAAVPNFVVKTTSSDNVGIDKRSFLTTDDAVELLISPTISASSWPCDATSTSSPCISGAGIVTQKIAGQYVTTFSPKLLSSSGGTYLITYYYRETGTDQDCQVQVQKNYVLSTTSGTATNPLSGVQASFCLPYNTADNTTNQILIPKTNGTTSNVLTQIAVVETDNANNILIDYSKTASSLTSAGSNYSHILDLKASTSDYTIKITAAYDDGGTATTHFITRTVYVAPDITAPTASPAVCSTNSSITLSDIYSSVTPTGGTFSGVGVSGNTLNATNTSIPKGQDAATVSYTVSNALSSTCQTTKNLKLSVYTPPVRNTNSVVNPDGVDFVITSNDFLAGSTSVICRKTVNANSTAKALFTSKIKPSADSPSSSQLEWKWNFGTDSDDTFNAAPFKPKNALDTISNVFARNALNATSLPNNVIRLRVKGAGGCEATFSRTLTVGLKPTVEFDRLTSGQICWDEVPTTPTAAKSKTIQLKLTNAGAASVNYYAVKLHTATTTTFENIDTKTTFYLKSQGTTGGDIFVFDSSLIGQEVDILYKNIETGSGCESTVSSMVIMRDPVIPTISVASSSNTNSSLSVICHEYDYTTNTWLDNSVDFTGSVGTVPDGVTVSSWQWSFGDGATSTVQSPSHVYASTYTNYADSKNVTLSVTTSGGCVSTVTKTLKVGKRPNMGFNNLTDGQTFCASQLQSSTGIKIEFALFANATYSYSITDTDLTPSFSTISQNIVTLDNSFSPLSKERKITYKCEELNSGCWAERTANFTVYHMPTASFTITQSSKKTTRVEATTTTPEIPSKDVLCFPLDNTASVAEFKNNSTHAGDVSGSLVTNITKWVFEYGDGQTDTFVPSGAVLPELTIPTNNIISHTYAKRNSNKDNKVKLTVYGKGGCVTPTFEVPLLLGNIPQASISNSKDVTTPTSTPATEFCESDLTSGITFSFFPNTQHTYSYTIGSMANGIAIGANSSITLIKTDGANNTQFNYSSLIGSPKTLSYTVRETDTECDNTVSRDITVYHVPVAQFSITKSSKKNAATQDVLCFPVGTNTTSNAEFKDESSHSDNFSNITSWVYSYGDAISETFVQTAPTGTQIQYPSSKVITHTYAKKPTAKGNQVSLIVYGRGGCVSSEVKKPLLLGNTPVTKITPPLTSAGVERSSFCSSELTAGISLTFATNDDNTLTFDYVVGSTGDNIDRNTAIRLISKPRTGDDKTQFDYSSLVDAPQTISYTATEDVTLCQNTANMTIAVYTNPQFDFGLEKNNNNQVGHCILPQNDKGTSIRLTSLPAHTMVNILWKYGDGGSTALTEAEAKAGSKYYSYSRAGNYKMELTIMDDKDCENTVSHQFPVAYNPAPQFYVQKLCETEDAEFNIKTGLPSNESTITKASYKIGRKIISSNGGFIDLPLETLAATTWTGLKTNQRIGSADTYSVRLYIRDSITYVDNSVSKTFSCQQSIVKNIPVVPKRTIAVQYLANFDTKSDLWGTLGWSMQNSKTNTFTDAGSDWTWNSNSSFSTIRPGSSSDYFWSTKGAIPYDSLQRAALYSPCFDLSQLTSPLMNFDYWADLFKSQGVYLEYSADGVTWKVLGTSAQFNNGQNWYNNTAIGGLSQKTFDDGLLYGQDVNQVGWSEATTRQSKWLTGKYDISASQYGKNIRFRFVFGTDGNKVPTGYDGFALNNFRIFERNKQSLAERFNASTGTDDGFYGYNFGSRTFPLTYYAALGNSTAARTEAGYINYTANKADPDARANFYGVTNPKHSFVNGRFGPTLFGTSSTIRKDDFSSWADFVVNNDVLDLAEMVIPEKDIVITKKTVNGVSNGDFEIKADLKLIANVMPSGTWNAYMVLYENEGTNQNTVRKFLPNAAGIPVKLSASQSTQLVVQNVSLANMGIKDYTKVGVLIFVQEANTKFVLNSMNKYGGFSKAANETYTAIETIQESIQLYPNPSNGTFTVEMPTSRQSHEFHLLNMEGKVCYSGQVEAGIMRREIATSGLPDGVYVLQLHTDYGTVRKKVVIIK